MMSEDIEALRAAVDGQMPGLRAGAGIPCRQAWSIKSMREGA